MNNNLKNITVAIFVISIIALGICFYIHSFSIKNVSIELKTEPVFSKVSGKITEINIEENSKVKNGEIIVVIDDTEYQNKADNIENQLAKFQKELNISKKDTNKINNALLKSKNEMEKAKNNLELANSDYIRYKNAYKDGSVVAYDLENAGKNLIVAKTLYEKAQKNNIDLTKKLKLILSKQQSKDKEIKNLLENLEQLKKDLSNTTIIAPTDGTVKNINKNNYINVSDKICEIISNNCTLTANLNNFQSNIKTGDKAIVKSNNFSYKTEISNVVNNEIKINLKDVDCFKLSKSKVSLQIK